MMFSELEAKVMGLTDPREIERIVEAVKFARGRVSTFAARTFFPGDKVAFTAKGNSIIGTVEKVNSKSLSLKNCIYGNGTPAPSYRVAPTLVTKVPA